MATNPAEKKYSFKRIAFYLAPYGAATYGAASCMLQEAIFKPTTNKQKLADTEAPGGGNAAMLDLIDGVDCSLKIANLDDTALSANLGASVRTLPANPTVTDQFELTVIGEMYPFSRMPEATPVIKAQYSGVWAANATVAAGARIVSGGKAYEATVGGLTGATLPTFTSGGETTDNEVTWLDLGTHPVTCTEGTDFMFTSYQHGGVIPLGGLLALGDTMVASYAAGASKAFEAMLLAAGILKGMFVGVNLFDNTKVRGFIHKMRFSPGEFALSSKEFDVYNATPSLERDDTVVGSELSKYYSVERT